jgi:hypothetical protein
MISGPIIEITAGRKTHRRRHRRGTSMTMPTTALFRLNIDGTLDTTFSGDGVLLDYADGTPGDELPGERAPARRPSPCSPTGAPSA